MTFGPTQTFAEDLRSKGNFKEETFKDPFLRELDTDGQHPPCQKGEPSGSNQGVTEEAESL
jgi:hypothetical protein